MKDKLSIKIYTTNWLIFITVIVYILDQYVIKWRCEEFSDTTILEKMLGFCGGGLMQLLGDFGTTFSTGEYWRVVTFLFPHVFILHLIVNMFALYKAGNVIEAYFGSKVILFSFFFIGATDQLIMNRLFYVDNTLTVGSSGAIFGILGISTITSIFNKGFIRNNYSTRWTVFYILYATVFTYTSGAWTAIAHNLGFLIGLFFGLILYMVEKFAPRNNELS